MVTTENIKILLMQKGVIARGERERKLQECYLRKTSSGTKDILIVIIIANIKIHT